MTTQLVPYYFDSGLVSANVQRTASGNGEEFVFGVNVTDEDLKSSVSERMEEYDERVNRWHVDADTVVVRDQPYSA